MSNFLDLVGTISGPWYTLWTTLLERLTTTTDANEAALSAVACTSSSSHSLTLGAKIFTLFPPGRVFPAGGTFRAVANADGMVSLAGTITSAGPGTMTTDVTEFTGAGGPYPSWTIVVCGPRGPTGATGPAVLGDPRGQALLAHMSRMQSYLP